jgi:uncharacterized protein (DUF3820 family)
MFNRQNNLELLNKEFMKFNIKNLTDISKNYFLNVYKKNLNICGNIGNLIELENLYFFFQFLKSSNTSNLLLNNKIYN